MNIQIPYTSLLHLLSIQLTCHPPLFLPLPNPSASSSDLALSVVYRTFFTYQYDTDDYLRSIFIIPVHSNVLILNESKSSLDEGAHGKHCARLICMSHTILK